MRQNDSNMAGIGFLPEYSGLQSAPVWVGREGAAVRKAAGAPPLYLLGHWLAGGRTMYTWSPAIADAFWLRFHVLRSRP